MTVQQGAQLGRYRLEALLGTGGMAEVWKAQILGPAGYARTLVVKRVLSHLARDSAFVKMFLAEAKLSALLAHPNIVQVYELAQEGNEFYMAMEYVDGCDLGLLLRRGKQLPIGFAVFVIQSVCRALGYAHTLRAPDGTPLELVHRDVTPSNIMLGREGAVKLLDFGIAKALGAASEHRTETGTLKGKLGYMSPEHVDGRPLDGRSDLFAAGVVLHELLTGRRLFKASSEFLTLSLMRNADVEPPSHINPAVPRALDAVVLTTLARDPAARYASADELVAALEPFLDGWNADRVRLVVGDVLASKEASRAGGAITMTADPAIALPSAVGTTAVLESPSVGVSEPERRVRWPVSLAVAAACILGGIGVYAAVGRSEPAVAAAEPAAATAAPDAAPVSPPSPGVASSPPPSASAPSTQASLPPPVVRTPTQPTTARVEEPEPDPKPPAAPTRKKRRRASSSKTARTSSSASVAPASTKEPAPASTKPAFDPESALP